MLFHSIPRQTGSYLFAASGVSGPGSAGSIKADVDGDVPEGGHVGLLASGIVPADPLPHGPAQQTAAGNEQHDRAELDARLLDDIDNTS